MEEEDTRTRILRSAEEEFLKMGFARSSLRQIVRNAGVTTGAFYGYFPSKEALFDALVQEDYETILSMYRAVLIDFHDLPPQSQQTNMLDYTRQQMQKLTDYVYGRIPAFQLILCASEGTRYASFIDDMANLDVAATHSFAQSMETMGLSMKPVNPRLEHMLTSGMFSAYFELIVHQVPRQEADVYISQLLDFYSAGWKKIMGF